MGGFGRSGRRTRRWGLAAVGAAAVLSVVVSACSGSGSTNAANQRKVTSSAGGAGGGSTSHKSKPKPSPTPPPSPVLSMSPVNGAINVDPAAVAKVTVDNATLSGVELVSSSGAHIRLAKSADDSTVSTAEQLGYDRTYTWTGRAVGTEGEAVAVSGRFRTLAPAHVMHAYINIDDRQQVGIAAPIIIRFDGHVTDRAAAERALTVRTSVRTVGSWAWLPDDSEGSRVHWRPERYWTPGTRVSVSAKLFGVSYGAGAYGESDITSSFAIGRSQVTRANVNSHRLVVYRNGRVVFNFPASYGLQSDPNRNTHNGIHIVMEKYPVKYMSNPAYGYVNIPEKWAVRISNNGEFIHDNDATDGVQGSANVTHGCVNLDYNNALAYYNSVLYGDPVEVTGSPIPLSASDGDVYDWTVPWAKWRTMSALS